MARFAPPFACLLLISIAPFGAEGVTAAFSAEAGAVSAVGDAPASHATAAVWDFDAAMKSLQEDGRLTLPAAGQERVLLLEARDFIVDRTIVHADPDEPSRVVGYVTAMPYKGVVEGEDDSLALITVDMAGRALIGTVYVDKRAIQVEYHDGGVLPQTGIITSTWYDIEVAAPTRRSEVGTLASYNTGIVVVGDSLYAVTGWTTRVTQAFNEQHDMWYQYPALNQMIYSFRTITHYPTTDGPTLLNYFGSWTTRFAWPTSVDAFQLFAANDLWQNGENIIGTGRSAKSEAEKLVHGSKDMVSAVEGWDHSQTDSYDPYNTRSLGIVSAHELGHNYGEWEHPQNYDSSLGGYNIMAGGSAIWFRAFWFTTQSNGRIIQDAWGQF